MPSITGKKTFGAGRFFGINNVSNPTPMRAILPQDMSIDFKRNVKELYGENQFSSAIAAGEMSVNGKVTMGGTNARIYSDLMFSQSGSVGQILEADKEAAVIPGTPFQIPVANSSTWTTDLGVINATTGISLVRVASSPATGQYSVSAGTYTFAAADTGNSVQISYLYTATTATAEKFTMANVAQGPTNNFTAVMAFIYGSALQDVLTLNNCLSTDSGIATKQSDFAKPTLGFMASTDNADVLGTFSFAQAQ